MGNVLTKRDGRNRTWRYTYDNKGGLLSATDPENRTTTYTYDGSGNRIKETDPLSKEKNFTYDGRNRLLTMTDALGNTARMAYNGDGKLIRQTDGDGKQVNYTYDTEGRLTETEDGNGNTITQIYAEAGGGCSSCSGGTELPVATVYPTFSREYGYDKRYRKLQERDISTETGTLTTFFTYDNVGNLISKKDKEGKTTTYVYDSLNRLVKVIDPLNGETAYTYDNRDNLIALKDAKNQVTTFTYDRNNRLTKERRPLGQETNYQYDGNGNLIKKTDPLGQRIEYGYDDANRMTAIRHYGSGNTLVKTVSLTYDNAGNLKTYSDGTTSASYTYDGAYRKTQETIHYGSFSKTIRYGYNKNGTKKSFTYPDGTEIGYTYDNNNQPQGMNLPGAGYLTYNGYEWTRPTGITLPGGSTRSFTYDPLMRTKTIQAKDPGQNAVQQYSYTYDKMDNITAKNTEQGNFTYGYDNLYRLNEVNKDSVNTETYTYDPVGNRLTSKTETNWNYNSNNELQGHDGTTYQYDANGNTTQKTSGGNTQNYVYDVDNRLVEVRDGSNTLIAAYTYDPFGRRIKKTVGSTTTYYLYADEGLIGEYDGTGVEQKTYGYKPDSTWGTDPVFVKEGGQVYFYQNDHLGTPQKLMNISGAVVWSASYDAFGKASVDASSTVVNNLRFPGQYYDQETGLHYNYHRYYDPGTGRFLREDPIGIRGGINLFLYCANNSVKRIDPWGLFDYYGKWGGPNRTAGMDGVSWDNLPESTREKVRQQIQNGWGPDSSYEPIDAQDACYMHHDICYGEARMYCRTREGCPDDCARPKKNKCDSDLGRCLIGIGLTGSALENAYRFAAIPVFYVQPGLRSGATAREIEMEQNRNSPATTGCPGGCPTALPLVGLEF